MRRYWMILLAAMLLLGCEDSDDGDTGGLEDSAELCADGLDNDGDGAIDCKDGHCLEFCTGGTTSTDTDTVETIEPNIPWDIVGIIGTGQSLSTGNTPVITESQPYNNLMLDLGNLDVPPFDSASTEFSLVPLIPPVRRAGSGWPRPYPGNIWGESHHSVMANQITAFVRALGADYDYVTVHSVVGESGQGMSEIEKGAEDTGDTGRAYAASIFEVEAITRLAAAEGKTYGVGAVVLTHGETDSGRSVYRDEIVQMWQDYNADIKAITGQADNIPMFVSQQHAYPDTEGGRPTATQDQWELGLDYPGQIICVGPNYQNEGHGDGIHLSTFGYQQYGEKLAEIYYEKVVLGNDWHPLQPINATAEGSVITVNYQVPHPPMVWADELPAPHQTVLTEWALGKGFEVRKGSTRVTITAVEIEGDSVVINCDSDLSEGGFIVGYAYSSDGVPMGDGIGGMRWGLLKDSDPFVGRATGVPLPNFSVMYELPVQ